MATHNSFYNQLFKVAKFGGCLQALIAAISLLTACQTAKPLTPTKIPSIQVKISPIQEKLVTDSSTFLATLKSRKAISLQPQVPGQIEEIFVTSGQDVTKGTLLIKLDQAKQTATVDSLMASSDSLRSERENALSSLKSLQANRQSKIATVEFCRSQLGRYSQLFSEGAVSHEAVEQHGTNLRIAESDLASLDSQIKAQQSVVEKDEKLIKQAGSHINEQKEQLRYYTVKAPLSGTIGDIPVKLGEYVTPSTILTTVNQNKPLEAYIDVPAEQSRKLKLGLSVCLLDSGGKVSSRGTICFIAPQVTNDNQSILVQAMVPNTDNLLRSGQLVSTRIIWKQLISPVVPTSCVSHLSGQAFAFVAENCGGNLVARQKAIEIGEIEGDGYRVISGLKAGEKLVTSGVQNLTDGMAISPKP